MKITNILKESCQKNVVLIKTKNKTFLTFLDKMQFSAILCLATYDWFCADGSHNVSTYNFCSISIASVNVTIMKLIICKTQITRITLNISMLVLQLVEVL